MDDFKFTRLRAAAIDKSPILFAEIFGTAFYMYGGCIGTLSWDGVRPNIVIPSITFGLVAMVVVQCNINLPNGHPYLNPAVTLAALIFRKTSLLMAIVYTLAQFIGATLGVWLLRHLTPTKIYAQSAGEYGVCQTFPNENLGDYEVFLIEYIGTMFWISMFCAVWDKRNQTSIASLPLIFGLGLFILSYIFIPLSGCSMSPVRSFGPAFLANNYKNQWIYMVAPMLSALITSIGYRVLFLGRKQSDAITSVESIHFDDSTKF